MTRGGGQKRTSVVFMKSFYSLEEVYKGGRGCLKITKSERTYFMDGYCIVLNFSRFLKIFTNTVMIQYQKLEYNRMIEQKVRKRKTCFNTHFQ